MAHVEILTGAERRRRWSLEERRALVEAAFAPGAIVRRVARQADVSTSLLYRWRDEQRDKVTGFAPVMIANDPAPAQITGPIEIATPGGIHIRIPLSISTELAAAIVRAACGR